MPAGLQVWDGSGNIMLDTSTIIGRTLGIIDASASSGSANVPGLDQGTPFAIPLLGQNAYPTTPQYDALTIPRCTFSGTTVSWVRQAIPTGYSTPSCKLVLGVR